jgi:hypothetical protein
MFCLDTDEAHGRAFADKVLRFELDAPLPSNPQWESNLLFSLGVATI